MAEQDITKTGALRHNELQLMNSIDNSNSMYQSLDNPFRVEKTNVLDLQRQVGIKDVENYVGTQAALSGFGDSKYDGTIHSTDEMNNLGNMRGENQAWYDLISNSVAKGGVLAGTTFLNGTAGLVVGVGTMVAEGRVSGIWDNAVTNALADINEYAEEKLVNHRTDAELEGPWYNHIFTANFLGESIIKNMGFMVGAFYSGGLASSAFKATGIAGKLASGALKAMKGTNKVLPKMGMKEILDVSAKAGKLSGRITSAVGAGVAAVAEGSIEAINNSRQWYDAEEERLGLKRDLNIVKIMQANADNPEMAELLIETENLAYENSMVEAAENRTKMGNMDLAFNLPVLWASGMTQFARQFSGGFKTARKVNNIAGKAGELTAKTGKTGFKLGRAALNSLAEGGEELGQEMGNIISGTHHSALNDSFYAQQLDPKAEQEAVSLINSFGEGFKETLSKGESWELFWVGAFSSALGMPMFGKRNNANSYVGKNKAFGLTGGFIGEYLSLTEEAKDEQKIVDYVNNTINSGKGKKYYEGLIRSKAAERKMAKAVENDDQFEYKNAEHNQLVSDITMFDNAGAIKDLIALVESSEVTSDADLDAIIEETTVDNGDGTFSGPFTDSNGNKLTDTKVNREKMKTKLNEKTKETKQAIDDYLTIKEDIDVATGQVLSNEQLSEIVWLKAQDLNWEKRAEQMGEENKEVLKGLAQGVSNKMELYDPFIVRASKGKWLNKKELLGNDEQSSTSINTVAIKSLQDLKQVEVKNLYFEDTKLSSKDLKEIEEYRALEANHGHLTAWTALSPVQMSLKVGEERTNDLLNNMFRQYLANGALENNTDALKFLNNSKDLKSLFKAKAMYKQRYDSYIANPGLVAEDMMKIHKEAFDKATLQVANNFGEAKNMKEFKLKMEQVDTAMFGSVLLHLQDSKDESIKKMANEYEEINQSKVIVDDIMLTDPNAQVFNSVRDPITTIFNDVESMEEVAKNRVDARAKLESLNKPEFVLAFDNFFKVFDLKKASFDTTKKDRNVARNKAKKVQASEKKTEKKGLLEKGKDLGGKAIKETKGFFKLKLNPNGTIIKEETNSEPEVEEETKEEGIAGNDNTVIPTAKKTLKANDETNASPSFEESQNIGGFRNWNKETRYDFISLANRDNRRMEVYEKGGEIREALDELGAYSFVDSGKLGRLVNSNPETRIHYVRSNDPLFKERLLLAVELTPEALKVVKSGENPITVNGKQYQIVGTLGFNGPKDMSAFNSIVYEVELSANPNEPYTISTKYHNQVKHIYSGRMVKSTDTDPVKWKPLNEAFLNKGEGDPVPLKIGFYYKEGDFRTPGLDPSVDNIETVNTNNLNKRDGSIWLMVQEADGVWYPKYVNLLRFTEGEYDAITQMDKPLMQDLLGAIKTILDPSMDDGERLEAKNIIEHLLYYKKDSDGLNKSYLFYDHNKDTNEVTVRLDEVGPVVVEGEDLDSKAMSVLLALLNDRLNLRFQLHPGDMADSHYTNKVLASEILTTDLHQPRNVNASFDLYVNDLTTGEPIKTEEDSGSTGHRGKTGMLSSLDKIAVYSMGKKYTIDKTPEATVRDLRGREITDSNLLDQIELSRKINTGEIKPKKGSNLYTGKYTQSGTPFGMIGKKLLTGEELTKELANIAKRQEAKEKAEATKKAKLEEAKQKTNRHIVGYTLVNKGNTVQVTAWDPKSGLFLIQYSKDKGFLIVLSVFAKPGEAKIPKVLTPVQVQQTVDAFLSKEVQELFINGDFANEDFRNELTKLANANRLELGQATKAPVETESITPKAKNVSLEELKKQEQELDDKLDADVRELKKNDKKDPINFEKQPIPNRSGAIYVSGHKDKTFTISEDAPSDNSYFRIYDVKGDTGKIEYFGNDQAAIAKKAVGINAAMNIIRGSLKTGEFINTLKPGTAKRNSDGSWTIVDKVDLVLGNKLMGEGVSVETELEIEKLKKEHLKKVIELQKLLKQIIENESNKQELNLAAFSATVEETALEKKVRLEKEQKEKDERDSMNGVTEELNASTIKGVSSLNSETVNLGYTLKGLTKPQRNRLFKKLGVTTFRGATEAIKNNPNLRDPDTMTTKEEFDGLLQDIECL